MGWGRRAPRPSARATRSCACIALAWPAILSAALACGRGRARRILVSCWATVTVRCRRARNRKRRRGPPLVLACGFARGCRSLRREGVAHDLAVVACEDALVGEGGVR